MATRAMLWAALLVALAAAPRAGAQRFTPPVDVGAPPFGAIGEEFQPALASSADGVWLMAVRSPDGLRVARSTDDGVTWETAATLDSMPVRSAPALAQRNGVWILVWNHSDGFLSHGLVAARSLDGGATWSTPLVLDADPAAARPLLAASGDAWVVVWTRSGSTWTRRSNNDGLGWTAARPIPFAATRLAASDAGWVLIGPLEAATSVDGATWEPDASWGNQVASEAVDLAPVPGGRFAAARVGIVSGTPTLIVLARRSVADGWQLAGSPATTDLGQFRLASDGAGTVAFLEQQDRRTGSAPFRVERRTRVRRLVPSRGFTASDTLHTGTGDLLGAAALGSIERAPWGTWLVATAVPRTGLDGRPTQQLIVARAVTTCADGVVNPAETCDPIADGAACCSQTCTPLQDGRACDSPQACGAGGCFQGRCAGVVTRCDPCESCDGADRCLPRVRDHCRVPGRRSRVALRLDTCADGACPDTLQLRWRGDVERHFPNFGDPQHDGDRLLCAFTSNRGVDGILFGVSVPGGSACDGASCWTRGKHTLRFAQSGHPVERLVLAAPNRRQSRFVTRISGPDLFRVAPRSGDRITLQLEAPNGVCWSAQRTLR